MSNPMYEIRVHPQNGGVAMSLFGCAGGYQFEVWLEGRLIGLSKFKFKNAEEASTAGMEWADCFFDIQ